MKTKKEEVIYGESVNVMELETVKVMRGSCLIGEYGSLNSIPPNIHHMIFEGIYRVEETKETILI